MFKRIQDQLHIFTDPFVFRNNVKASIGIISKNSPKAVTSGEGVGGTQSGKSTQ